MNIVIFSDSHGNDHAMESVVAARQGDTDLFLHLGDGAFSFLQMGKRYPDRAFACVRGNCDLQSLLAGEDVPLEDTLNLDGVRIFYTHGHRYGVKYGIESLFAAGAARHADILLYGHTHEEYLRYFPATPGRAPMYVCCPGSIGEPRGGAPSYACLSITKQGIDLHLAEWQG